MGSASIYSAAATVLVVVVLCVTLIVCFVVAVWKSPPSDRAAIISALAELFRLRR